MELFINLTFFEDNITNEGFFFKFNTLIGFRIVVTSRWLFLLNESSFGNAVNFEWYLFALLIRLDCKWNDVNGRFILSDNVLNFM